MKSISKGAVAVAFLMLAVAVSETEAAPYGRSRGRQRGKNASAQDSGSYSSYSSNQRGRRSRSGGDTYQSSHQWTAYQPTPAVPLTHDGNTYREVTTSQGQAAASRLVRAATSPAPASTPAPAETLPQVAPGSEVMLNGTNLGTTPGTVALEVHEMILPVEILNWTTEGTTVRIPAMVLNSTTPAALAIVLPDGTVARTIDVALAAGVAGKL